MIKSIADWQSWRPLATDSMSGDQAQSSMYSSRLTVITGFLVAEVLLAVVDSTRLEETFKRKRSKPRKAIMFMLSWKSH